jgi:hypothetical protein
MAVSINERATVRRLVAAGNDTIFYEDLDVAAGTLTELDTSGYAIDTSDNLNMYEAFQKVFVVNGGVLGVADFVNTKITDGNGFTTKPARGDIVYQAGTSAATMVVDYINSTDNVMYGYVTSGTFEITTAITSAVGGGGNVIFPSPVAGLSKPRWYAWTPYDNDTTTYGSMPTKAYLGCLYRGRCVLAGNPNYPHQWYMSKTADPWNWVYASTDPLTAAAGQNADAGEIGDIIRALIPYKDDYLIFGCASTIWVLTGDPAAGGEIDEVDLTVGMFGANSWCFDGDGNLYFWGTAGIYKIPLGFRSVENLTEISLPDLVAEQVGAINVTPSTHRIIMGYDRKRHGILICITTLETGSNSNYWYDLKLGGFFPESYPNECGPYSLFYYAANDNDYADLLVGCKDGYIRKFDETAKDDNVGGSTDPISSYAVWPIQHLTEDNDREGKLTSLTIELSGGASGGAFPDTNGVSYEIHVGDDAETVIENIRDSVTPLASGTLSGTGRKNRIRTRVRGAYLGIKFLNSTATETFGINKVYGTIVPAGKIK